MKYRFVKCSGIITVLFLVDWIASSVPYLSAYRDGIIQIEELVLNWSDASSGYQSLLEYGLLYIIPYIWFLNQTIQKESIICMLRRKSRPNMIKADFKKIVSSAAVFCALHEGIAIIMTCCFVPKSVLLELKWMRFELIHMLLILLFYINIGILYRVLSICIDREKGMFLLFLLCAAQFYHTIVTVSGWQPYRDVVLLHGLLLNRISCFDAALAVCRQILFVLVLFIMEETAMARKDIWKNEIFT